MTLAGLWQLQGARGKRQSPGQWPGLRAGVRTTRGQLVVRASPVAAGTGALLAGLGLVDRQGAALELDAVQSGDGFLAAFAHLDEAEAARAARLAVA